MTASDFDRMYNSNLELVEKNKLLETDIKRLESKIERIRNYIRKSEKINRKEMLRLLKDGWEEE